MIQQAESTETTLKQRLALLEAKLATYQQVEKKASHHLTFPEQNPNLVIETNLTGQITYLNPIAKQRFPDLWELGQHHPILHGLAPIIDTLQQSQQEYTAREIDIGQAVFEQKICYSAGHEFIRIYAHDITARKRAEEASQKLARRLVIAQEEERQRVSRELHDEAGQALTALKISLELLQADLPSEALSLYANFTEAIGLIDITREHIRLLAHGLRPPALDTLGLNLALENYCHTFARRTQQMIQYTGVTLPPLSDAISISLYRFLQEALTNAAKHAEATVITVQLSWDKQEVLLSVRDDGQGFDSNELSPAGIGLVGMHERLDLLGGGLHIHSQIGQGTHLVAYLPLG